ncbi:MULTISPECIES: TIGR03086 family metal-binding protein [unclassified Streptomyces]|uniref:TIGR03086 family metal-binding protein n=1 Tax=unclassified Streptomyces TaxID=2593676 RepID=UPI0034203D33
MSTTQYDALRSGIRECADAVTATVAGVRDEQLQEPTPCAKFTVADLVEHLTETLLTAERAARREAPSDEAPAGSPSALVDAVGRTAAAWSDAAAYEGTTKFGEWEMPAVVVASITLQELAVHGWDLARATGRPFSLGEDTGRLVLDAVEQIADQVRGNGGYGPPVAVPADAPAFRRALATSGRDPEWNS